MTGYPDPPSVAHLEHSRVLDRKLTPKSADTMSLQLDIANKSIKTFPGERTRTEVCDVSQRQLSTIRAKPLLENM